MRAERGDISFPVFFAVCLASIGGPLALIALYFPIQLGSAASSAGLVAIISVLLFLFPLLVWYRYSARIASRGGLYAFVEAAVGRRVALVQAAFWLVSYFLYLVYTVPYIVYRLLPIVFPGLGPSRLLLDGLLAVIVAAIMLAPRIVALSSLVLIAVIQMLVALNQIALGLDVFGIPPGSFVGHGNLQPILFTSATASLLYVCASLPIFLGGEVRGGGRSVQRGIAWAFAVASGLTVLAAFPLAAAPNKVLATDIPGFALVKSHVGEASATLVGVAVALSVSGLIIAEFLALGRVLGAIFNRPTRLMILISSAAFLAGSLISLIDPNEAYDLLLKPSLIALWISQLIVVAVYPWFVRKHGQLGPVDISLATVASGLMLFALYTAITSGSTT